MPPELLAWITTQVNLFFGSFRKADADDPEVFHSGCTRLFSVYPREVVEYVVDPVTGLSTRSEWLPSLKRVKEALEERAEILAGRAAAEKRALEQIEARKQEFEVRKARPTLSELKERYGENWGLRSPGPVKEEIKSQRREQLQAANRRTFAMECRAAGFPEDSPISPSLAALIRAGVA